MKIDNSINSVLVLDDDSRIFSSLELIFADRYNLFYAETANKAFKILSQKEINLVFLDINISTEKEGLDILKKIKIIDKKNKIYIVMISVYKDVAMVVEAMKSGAFGYINKPFEPDEIESMLKNILDDKEKLVDKKKKAYKFIFEKNFIDFEGIIGQDKGLLEIFSVINKISKNDTSVLISGESGTGKELIARAIHYKSNRKEKSFVAVNCSAIPENLLETELFGYERGAFTGAVNSKKGKIELSHGGTFFLDEIGSMPINVQSKLLRVVQEKEVEHVGGNKSIKFDSRIVSATNINIKDAIERNEFRLDLFYRLGVILIHIPSLRERKDDIPLLIEYYIDYFNKKFKKSIKGISDKALKILKEYNWPGNIRELRNVLEKVIVLSENNKHVIESDELPFDIFINENKGDDFLTKGISFKEAKDNFERKLILSALKRADWNQTRAANLLGIHRNTIITKINEFNIGKE